MRGEEKRKDGKKGMWIGCSIQNPPMEMQKYYWIIFGNIPIRTVLKTSVTFFRLFIKLIFLCAFMKLLHNSIFNFGGKNRDFVLPSQILNPLQAEIVQLFTVAFDKCNQLCKQHIQN